MLLVPQVFCLCIRAHLSVNAGVSHVVRADSPLQQRRAFGFDYLSKMLLCKWTPAEWYVGPRPMTSCEVMGRSLWLMTSFWG